MIIQRPMWLCWDIGVTSICGRAAGWPAKKRGSALNVRLILAQHNVGSVDSCGAERVMASQSVLVVLAALVTATPGTVNDRIIQKNAPLLPTIRISAPQTVPASISPRRTTAPVQDHLPPIEITGPAR